MCTTFHVIHADGQQHLTALRSVRETMCRREQRVPVEREWDGLEAIDFYRHFGFVCREDPFLGIDIPHQGMFHELSDALPYVGIERGKSGVR